MFASQVRPFPSAVWTVQRMMQLRSFPWGYGTRLRECYRRNKAVLPGQAVRWPLGCDKRTFDDYFPGVSSRRMSELSSRTMARPVVRSIFPGTRRICPRNEVRASTLCIGTGTPSSRR